MKFIKKLQERYKRDKEIKAEADKVYQEVKAEQAIRVAKQRAKIEADQKIKKMKEPKRSFLDGMGNVAEGILGTMEVKDKKPKKKDKRNKDYDPWDDFGKDII